jgi:hypothetical protein
MDFELIVTNVFKLLIDLVCLTLLINIILYIINIYCYDIHDYFDNNTYEHLLTTSKLFFNESDENFNKKDEDDDEDGIVDVQCKTSKVKYNVNDESVDVDCKAAKVKYFTNEQSNLQLFRPRKSIRCKCFKEAYNDLIKKDDDDDDGTE